jgi:hypothetical protein
LYRTGARSSTVRIVHIPLPRGRALVTPGALSLGVLGPAATVSAADRPSTDGTKPNYYNWPRSGETGSNHYHADYHADYSANRGGDRTGGRDEIQGREPTTGAPAP